MTGTQKITRKQIEKEIKEIIDAKGEDTTAACTYYTDNGRPMCILGHWLHGKGVTRAKMHKTYNKVSGGEVGEMGSFLYGCDTVATLDALGLDFTPSAFEYAGRLQEVQDSGKTWGEAHEVAKKVRVRT